MITRRTFIAASAAAGTLPWAVQANASDAFDPTPQVVRIKKQFEPGRLLILPRSFYLYYVTEEREAIRYGCGVGKAGLEFTGTATIDVKRNGPPGDPPPR